MKWLKSAGFYLLMIPVCALLMVGLVLYLLFVPFDWLFYRFSYYRKGTKEKYSLFLTSGNSYKFYNLLSKNGHPFELIRTDYIQYFLMDGQVILTDFCDGLLEYTDDTWYVRINGDNDKSTLSETIEFNRCCLHPEHRELPVRVLAVHRKMKDSLFSQAQTQDIFYCCESI